MASTKTEWYFIVNPRAGSGKTMSKWVPAERRLAHLGVPFTTAMTDHKQHAIELAYNAASQGYRRIAAVGGDGSVHEVLNGICRWCEDTDTPTEEFYIAVIPIGSGNDWIHSLGVPNDIDKVVDLILAESFGKVDVIRLRTAGDKVSYMANIGGVGFDSHVCERVNLQKERGYRSSLIYAEALLYAVFHPIKLRLSVYADGKEVFRGACYDIGLGNGCYCGGGMRQVPLAVMDDGKLDFMILPAMLPTKILKLIPKVYSGTLNESPAVLTGRCKRLEIVPLDSKSADIIELDGEIKGRLPAYLEPTGHMINAVKA